MRSHSLGADENLHPIRMTQYLHSKPRIMARNGIPVLIHNDRGILIGPTAGCLYIAESSFGKGNKMRLLLLIQFIHCPIPPGHLMIPIRNALPKNLLVELFQVSGLRNRNHVIASCKANQTLNTTLFVTAVGIAETGIKTVVCPELAKSLLLNPISTA